MINKQLLTKSLPYLVGIAVFFLISALYLRPAFDDYSIRQMDYINYVGGSNDLVDFHERTNKEPLWTESMFSGMPAAQIAVFDKGDYTNPIRKVLSLGLPSPVDIMFLGFIGFFIAALCFKVNPWVAIVGAIAFGLSSYTIILLQVGHVTKLYAIAFMAPTIGAFYLAYRRNLLWGVILSALFMALELGSNHVQIAYYLGFVLVAMGLFELVCAVRNKTYKKFMLSSVGVVVAYALAALTGAANLLPTQEYAQESIRGANNISITPDLTSNKSNSTAGLDKDYITAWSNGKSESLTFFIPFAKGGHTVAIANGDFADKLENSDFSNTEKQYISGSNQYWADQPFTSGPVYFGAITFFLAILGMFFIQSAIKWPLFGVSLLALFLSWGKNMMWFTDIFLEHVPLYNKFRAVSIILVVLQVCVPLLAMFFLHELWKNKERILEQKKKLLIVSGAFLGFMLLLIASPSITGLYSQAEKEQLSDPSAGIEANIRQQIAQLSPEQLKQYGVDPSNKAQLNQFIQQATQQQVSAMESNMPALKNFRTALFRSSAWRSFFFMALAFGLVWMILKAKTEKSSYLFLAGIGILVAVDMLGLDSYYLNQDEFDDKAEYKMWMPNQLRNYPLTPKASDMQILEQEMAQNSAMENAVIQAEQTASSYAREHEFETIAKRNYIDNERFKTYNRMTHFRVADLTENVFNSSRTSYFHESIGGYHGAKLRRYQNLVEFGYLPNNQAILGMLNAKYIVQGSAEQPNVRMNPFALGNAWLVPKVEWVNNENEAILSLGSRYSIQAENGWNIYVNDIQTNTGKIYGRENVYLLKSGQDTIRPQWPNGLSRGLKAAFVRDINGKTNWMAYAAVENDTTHSFEILMNTTADYTFEPRENAIVLKEYKNYLGKSSFSGKGEIKLTSQQLNDLVYSFNSDEEQLVVFSEIYYPVIWKAFIDGKPSEYIPVNYTLRGLKVPKGKHTIEFKVVDQTYTKGLLIARVSSSIILLLLLGGVAKEIIERRKKQNTPTTAA